MGQSVAALHCVVTSSVWLGQRSAQASVTGFCKAHPQLPDALLSPLRPYLLASIAPRCQGSVGSIVGLVPGVISLSPGESVAGAHQGRHSKSSQYRRMKAEWKSNVYLARSRIQVGHLQRSPNT